jgi:hypothetical protein
MSELGANCLRVYNLQPPAFYCALAAHNRANSANPLYLIQGIWLEDAAPPYDLTAQTATFDAAIETAVRRIHGAGDPATPDISRWVCAFLPGHEVTPAELRATDKAQGDAVLASPRTPLESGTATGFFLTTGVAECADVCPSATPHTPVCTGRDARPPVAPGGTPDGSRQDAGAPVFTATPAERTPSPDFTPGRHFRVKSGTRTERWVAARLEHLVAFERAEFGTERPVGFSSWPPLDPLRHPTESRDSDEDTVALDLANLEAVDAPAGFFVSYHVYPYNPDFMNEDPGYRGVRDADGPNPYLGYLRDLKTHYRGIPLLVAEFGIPSSWGCARFNPASMGHGGHDETEQGRISARLLRSIRDSGCAGGVYFAWIDEWWKGNWITRKLNFPQERRRFLQRGRRCR